MKNPAQWVSNLPMLMTTGLALVSGAQGLPAQEATPYTLHVYTNLVQVPTLVLADNQTLISGLKRDQFSISLDGGAPFHPTQMRTEGNDAISLSVLLDASGGVGDLVKVFADAFANLAPKYLRPEDHVSIYAVDCEAVRSVSDIPADAEDLKAGVASALASPGLHGTQRHRDCGSTVRLWDTVALAARALGDLPGRRVLLVVSNGRDGKSTSPIAQVVSYAGGKSVTIFGLRDWDLFHSRGGSVDRFDQLCQSNGGIVLSTMPKELEKSLQSIVTMLRGRYIVEFPRPEESRPGTHTISIVVPGTDDIVWVTGATFPPPDPTVLADPNTVHSSKSPATFGNRNPASSK